MRFELGFTSKLTSKSHPQHPYNFNRRKQSYFTGKEGTQSLPRVNLLFLQEDMYTFIH